MNMSHFASEPYEYLAKYYEKRDNKEFQNIISKEITEADKRGYGLDLLFIKDTIEYIRNENRLVLAGGNGAYSVYSFLLGITERTDPFYHGYYPEMLYGLKWERRPFIPLTISPDFEGDIVRYLENTYGKEDVEYDGHEYCISVRGEGGSTVQSLSLIRDYTVSFVERLNKDEYATRDNLGKNERSFPGRIGYDCTVTDDLQTVLNSGELPEVISDYISLADGVDEAISENTKEFFQSVYDNTFYGLIKVMAAIKGSNIWNLGDNAADYGLFTRDDVYNYVMKKYLLEKENAYSVMEYVRRGMKLKEEDALRLLRAGASDRFIRILNEIRYMKSERGLFPYVQVVLWMASEKKKNRNHYLKVFDEVLRLKESAGI